MTPNDIAYDAVRGLVRSIPRDLQRLATLTENCHPSGTINVMVVIDNGEGHDILQGSSSPFNDLVSFTELRDQLREYITAGKQAQDATLDGYWESGEREGLEEDIFLGMERSS